MGKQAEFVAKNVFDRILHGDDMGAAEEVESFEHGGDRGAFSGAGRSADQEKAGPSVEPAFDDRSGQTEGIQVRDVCFAEADDGTGEAEALEKVDPNPAAVSEDEAGVEICGGGGAVQVGKERVEKCGI